MKTVLIISASDSIAGAGMQADLKTCTLMGTYAATCLTAITAQNTGEVRDVFTLPAQKVTAQIDCILDDIKPDAVKVGMLGSTEVVDAVCEALKRHILRNVVIDPVLVATCGDKLTEASGSVDFPDYLAKKLFPLATLVTPNMREATELTGIDAVKDPDLCSKTLIEKYGVDAVLLKGGDASGETAADVLYTKAGRKRCFELPRVNTVNTHGTGCTLSSAIAVCLAAGHSTESAVEVAKLFVHRELSAGKDCVFGKFNYGPVILKQFDN